jgi:ribosome-associated protein
LPSTVNCDPSTDKEVSMAVKHAKTSRRTSSSTSAAKTVRGPATIRAAAKKTAPKKAPRKSAAVAKLKAAPGAVVKVVENALDDMKALNVKVLNVHKLTDITDTMIIASGNSDRHVRSIADRVIEFAKKAGFRPMGVEGERDGEWVLVDLQDVIVHIMLPRVREFYRLESLWDVSAARREAAMG